MSSAPPDTASGAFVDARTCKVWLGALPATSVPQAMAQLAEGLRGLNAGSMAGMERLKCLELLREKAGALLADQRASLNKALPLPPNDANAWLTGRSVLDELESGYRKVLAACVPDPELARHAALVSQRIVRYMGAQALYHAIGYRRMDAARWARLHETYRHAEHARRHDERVKDSHGSEDGTSSVAEAYVQALLLGAAGMAELRGSEIDYAAALARLWSRKVKVLPGGTAEGAPLLAGADTAELSLSIRKRIHALGKDEPVEKLGMPAVPADVDVGGLLHHLHRRWCEAAAEPAPRAPAEKQAGLVFGGNEIHFFLAGGKPFEQPDKKRELTPREKQDIEVFGRVTERTSAMMVSEHNYTVERWDAIEELLGAFRLVRPASSSRSVSIGKLVAMRLGDAAPFFLGMVSALTQEPDGRMVVTVTLYPGKPEIVPVRAADARNRANAKWSEGFRLPEMEKLKVPASLFLPAGMAQRGRGVETWEGEPKEKTVYEVLKRGSDYDRITVF